MGSPEDSVGSTSRFLAHLEAQDASYVRRLAAKRARCIGTHDTGLRCVCKAANIMDHATEHDPTYRPSIGDIRMGPQPSARDLYDHFRVYHQYWCRECGVVYRGEVIEGKRGYVPPEKRPVEDSASE